MTGDKQKVIVVVGPTAVGKSALAVRLARALNGEVISADSRQVYRGLDIGSGKITRAEMKNVPHHLLDVASVSRTFTAAEFQKAGQKAIAEIAGRGKIPIVCGGSGFYVQALVDSVAFPEVPPNRARRAELEKKTAGELCRILKKLDHRRYQEIDKKNPRRLVRAIEIAETLGRVPGIKKEAGRYDPLFIGLILPNDELKKKIRRRLDCRFRRGLVAEVKKLHENGVSWKRLDSLGLEYRTVAGFLRSDGKRDGDGKNRAERKKEMTARLEKDIGRFAKRQMVWFKRDKRIGWFQPKDWKTIKKTAGDFLAG